MQKLGPSARKICLPVPLATCVLLAVAFGPSGHEFPHPSNGSKDSTCPMGVMRGEGHRGKADGIHEAGRFCCFSFPSLLISDVKIE